MGLALFHAVVLSSCLLAFLQASDANYRSRDGHLGRTMPSWQEHIVAGTAPAPYVYRQGVPRLRQAFMVALQPGHAAVLADLLFAVVAVGAGTRLAAFALGRALAFVGAITTAFACIAVYPNEKPESVAMVAVTALAAALIVDGRHTLAAIVAACAATIRPEIPVLLAVATITVAISTWRRDQNGAAQALVPVLPWAGALAAGLLYLALARLWLWPAAAYPPGLRIFGLARSVVEPLAWPGITLALALAALGVMLALPAWSLNGSGTEALEHRLATASLGLYAVLYVLAFLTLGAANEVRLHMPIVPPLILLGAHRLALGSATAPKAGTP